jgi:pilus assembly protein Flp/PilA
LVEGETRMKLIQNLLRFTRNRSGATAVEYCLLAGIICLAVVGGVTALGSSANGAYQAANAGFN